MFGNNKKDARDLEIEAKDGLNIFTPSIYHGTNDQLYRRTIAEVELHDVIPLVQKRAREDGQWCIDMNLVGHNEDKMRKMIEYVSDPINITETFRYITHHEDPTTRDIDFICRDLANGSRRGL
jgi:hypothetical protein